MAIIAPYQRTEQAAPISGQKQNISAPAAAFGTPQAEALINAGTAASRLGEQWNKKAINIADENNELYALKEKTAIETQMSDFLYNPENGLLTKKGYNALTATDLVSKRMDEIQKSYDGRTDLNPAVRDMLNKELIRTRGQYTQLAQRHKLQEYTQYKNETLNAAIESNVNDIALNFMDDENFQKKADENFKLLQSRATSEGWDDKKLTLEKNKAYAEMRGTQIEAMIATDDPQKIVMAQRVYNEARSRGQMDDFDTALKIEKQLQAAVPKAAAYMAYHGGRTAVSGEDEVINFVIDKQEGGDKVTYDTGGETKFGISKKAFPNVDVKNLTREEATKIYKDEFWNRRKISDLPESMQLLAFDTVVNHYAPFAEKVLAAIQNGATADEVLNLRLKEYQRLKQDPKYAPNYNGWVNRLQKLKDQNGGQYDAESAYATAAELEKRYKGAGAEMIALFENGRKQAEAMKTAHKNDIQEQVQKLNSENNGDWTKIPAALRAEAAANGIDVTQYKGVSDPAMKDAIDSMPTSDLANLDLNDPAYAKSLSYSDRQAYIKKQQELLKPENKFMSEKIDGVVAYYFKSQMEQEPTLPENKSKVAKMKNYVSFNAERLIKAGKIPTEAELNKFASEYLQFAKTTFGDYNSNIGEIPEEDRKRVEQVLIDNGTPVTEGNIIAMYIQGKKAGYFKDGK